MIEATADGVRIKVRVQPRASRTEVAGRHGDALKVRLTAPPVEGAANEALLRLIAGRLGVVRSAVRLAAGATARSLVVAVDGITPEAARARLGL